MNLNRCAIAVTVAIGFVFFCEVPAVAQAQSARPVSVQTPNAPRPGVQPKGDAVPPDDFAGLNYTDDQKAELDKIHRETESLKEVVSNDQKLTEDQKNAMLLGYTRMESVQAFRVLTPEQQKQVRKRILARKAEDQASKKKQTARN